MKNDRKFAIRKIVRVEIKNGKRTEHELTKDEIEKWQEQHKGANLDDSTGI